LCVYSVLMRQQQQQADIIKLNLKNYTLNSRRNIVCNTLGLTPKFFPH